MEQFLLVFIFLLGAIFGSFLNALMWRIHERKSITRGRSMCPSCHTELRAFELIPIFSFLVLRGKCRNCLEKISWQYPLVEFFVGFLFVLVYQFVGAEPTLLTCYWYLVLVLTIVFVYDLRYQLILDSVVLPATAIVLVANIVHAPAAWPLYVVGLLLGGGFFLLQFVVSHGRWIGGGDIRLGAFMGALLGWKLLLVALFLAYIVGAVISLVLVGLKKRSMASKTPFGTYLSVATFVTLLWGQQLLDWYLGLVL